MNISQAGIDFIKDFEKLRLKAYQDEAGVWTLGYGSTKGIHAGDECTKEEAENMLEWDLAEAVDAVNMYVDVDLDQNQFDALVSFTFNCGVSAFHGSTLLRMLNNGAAIEDVGQQFKRWNRSGGHVSNGLVRRREDERKMFCGEA